MLCVRLFSRPSRQRKNAQPQGPPDADSFSAVFSGFDPRQAWSAAASPAAAQELSPSRYRIVCVPARPGPAPGRDTSRRPPSNREHHSSAIARRKPARRRCIQTEQLPRFRWGTTGDSLVEERETSALSSLSLEGARMFEPTRGLAKSVARALRIRHRLHEATRRIPQSKWTFLLLFS